MTVKDLTPVEKRGDLWFKRDDLYVPFEFSPANGSKLRQCQILIEKNLNNSGLITGTSIKSPQAVIVASVAKYLNKPCHILYGGTNELNLSKNKYATLCSQLGADIQIASKMAFTSVLNARAEDMARTHNLYNVRYGFDLMNNIDAFIDSTALQVRNLPDTNNLVVTVGSAITIIGILYGLAICDVKIDKVYAIGCAPNRLGKIQYYADMIFLERGVVLPLDKIVYIDAFNLYRGFKYENTFNENYEGITFHPRYEAKTFHWLKEQQLNGTTLMWITGQDFI